MSKSNTAENGLLALIFNQTTWTGVAATSGGTAYFLALHTADPGEGGDQTTSEAAYTSYGRVSINRNSGGFTVSSSTVQNAAEIVFPTCTGGSETLTHWSLGLASSGASTILYKGSLNSSLAVSNTIAPRFAAGQLTITED
jgi:hypothetical protein